MSNVDISDVLTKERVLQLANQYSDNWMTVVPEFGVPLWHLFIKTGFQFEDWEKIPGAKESLLTIDWDDKILEGPYQGASFAWCLVQLPESDEKIVDMGFRVYQRFHLCDWNNAPTSGPLSSCSLGWSLLLRKHLMYFVLSPFHNEHKKAVLEFDWNQKGPNEWAEVTFAWMVEYEFGRYNSMLFDYSREKTVNCDWAVAPKSGPNQGMTLGWLLSRKFNSQDLNSDTLAKLIACDWDYAPTEGYQTAQSMGWQVAGSIPPSSYMDEAYSKALMGWLEKLLECDWNQGPTTGENAGVTLGWMVVSLKAYSPNNPKFLEKLRSCSWGAAPTNPRHPSYQKSLAWNLIKDDASFPVLIQSPGVEQALVQADWDMLPNRSDGYYSRIFEPSIAHLVTSDPNKVQWLVKSKSAQAKLALSDWEASHHKEKLSSLLANLWHHDETRRLLLTDPKWINRLCQCRMDNKHSFKKVYGKIGAILMTEFQQYPQSMPVALAYTLVDQRSDDYYVKKHLGVAEILLTCDALNYDFIPVIQLAYQPSTDSTLKIDHLPRLETLRDIFLECLTRFSTYNDLCCRRYGHLFSSDLKQIIFRKLLTQYFPTLTNNDVIAVAFAAWQQWDAARAPAPLSSESVEKKLATLMVYRKRLQCGVLWNLTHANEKAFVTQLASQLLEVTPKVGLAKSVFLELGSQHNIQSLSRTQLAEVFSPEVIFQKIMTQNGLLAHAGGGNQPKQATLSDLKITLSQILNKALPKQHRWDPSSDKKSSKFFTPHRGERTHHLAIALQSADSATDMKLILRNQLDIYENPKARAPILVIQDAAVSDRLNAPPKRAPNKGIKALKGYYALLTHLMETILSYEANLAAVELRHSPPK